MSTLAQSLAIFDALGWGDLTPAEALDADLGTPEQRTVALAGLRRGALHEVVKDGSWLSFRSLLGDRNPEVVALFGLRLGVDARRVIDLAPFSPVDELSLARAIATRGDAFATAFNARVRPGGIRRVAILVSHLMQLPVPTARDQLERWVHEACLGLTASDPHREGLLAESVLMDRFVEHVTAAVHAGLPPEPLSQLLTEGRQRHLMGPAQTYDLALYALTSAIRPADQKGWANYLVDATDATGADLRRDVEALIPVLAAGQPQVIAALAPALIHADLPDGQLASVVLAAFAVKTTKGRRDLLALLAKRPAPVDPEALALCLATIEPLASDGDLTKAAHAVLDAWGQTVTPVVDAPPAAPQGRWKAAPPVWQQPRFDPGVAADLPETVAQIRRSSGSCYTILHERCLVQVKLAADSDPDSVRALLRPYRGTHGVLWAASDWARGSSLDIDHDYLRPLLTARDYQVMAHIHALPCILSTPSWVDGRIDAADLVARLEAYAAAGVPLREADVALAFLRLDPATMTDELLTQVRAARTPVHDESGAIVAIDLESLVGVALVGPETRRHGRRSLPEQLSAFPERAAYDSDNDLMTWPCLADDNAQAIMRGYPGEGVGAQGQLAVQVAQSPAPLGPRASINLLASLDSPHSAVIEGVARGIEDAWVRGLLRPGVADVAYLDGRDGIPTRVASLVAALREGAELSSASVVWPILDDLVAACNAGVKPVPGTAEAVELLAELVPDARAAIAEGVADASVLDLPGVRALAGRGGSSKAVAAASRLCAALGIDAETEKQVPAVKGLWRKPTIQRGAVPDDATLTLTELGATITSPS